MDLPLNGWRANWCDHAGASWGFMEAASRTDAQNSAPEPEFFDQPHNLRIQLFSPNADNGACAFLGSYRSVEPGSVRFVELSWEFAEPTRALWQMAIQIAARVQVIRISTSIDNEILWAVERDLTVQDGKTHTLDSLLTMSPPGDGRGFMLSVGDIEISTLPERLGGVATIANLIWPADMVSYQDLQIPERVVSSRPMRFDGISAKQFENVLDHSLKYLRVR